MIQTIEAVNGGYRFMPGVSQYSCRIAGLGGFGIERICFSNVVPLKQGFEKIAEMIKDAGRPLKALGACELRRPHCFRPRRCSSTPFAMCFHFWKARSASAACCATA